MNKAFTWNVNINGRTVGDSGSKAAQLKRHQLDLGPSAEYWLARLTREHASRIFILAFLVLAIIFAISLQPLVNPQPDASNYAPPTTIINTGDESVFNGRSVEIHTDNNTFVATYSGGRTVKIENGVVTENGVIINR